MAVHAMIDRQENLLVYRLGGIVNSDEITAAVRRIAAEADPQTVYRTLIVFDTDADLSELGTSELKAIKAELIASHTEAKIQRDHGAIVLNGSIDAQIIMPFWKALFETDPTVGITHSFYPDVMSALDTLGARPSIALRDALDIRDEYVAQRA